MKRFKILEVKHILMNDKGNVTIYNSLLNKQIELPYPEFSSECILIIANPIDLVLLEGGKIVGEMCLKENIRTCYFLKPYSDSDFNYWKIQSQDNDYWIPFFPEQKEIIYTENGYLISFYKDISFNKNWHPISHALYFRRTHAEHLEELDYMDIEVTKYEEIGLEEYELNNVEDNFEVYATEFFGEIEDNECQDECWACAKLLQKEMLFIVEITTEEEGKRKDYIREVLGLDLRDALEQVFQGDGGVVFSDVTSYRVYHNNALIRHEGSWIKN